MTPILQVSNSKKKKKKKLEINVFHPTRRLRLNNWIYNNYICNNSTLISLQEIHLYFLFIFSCFHAIRIFISLYEAKWQQGDDSRTDEKLGSRQGRDISRCNDYLAQVGRFFISLRRSPQKKKSTRSFPSSRKLGSFPRLLSLVRSSHANIFDILFYFWRPNNADTLK